MHQEKKGEERLLLSQEERARAGTRSGTAPRATAGTGAMVPANGRSLFVLDTNVIEMRVLQDVSYEELAKTNDSIKFMLKCYEVLVCKAPQFNHVIIDIGA